VVLEFSGEIWYWKGPAPHHFVTVPEPESAQLRDIVKHVTYGWGMVPVKAKVGNTEWETALWPKDGKYILPLKLSVRRAEGLQEGDSVIARLDVVITPKPFG